MGVALIPKLEEAVEINDFKLISMIGRIYKIVFQILANRLTKIPDLGGESQSAFVKNREILDGVLVVNEAFWWLKKTRQKAAILKIDLQKTYDTIQWNFVQEIVIACGLEINRRIGLQSNMASMSILINGSPASFFQVQRGLRQGDPLSPFFFLLLVVEISNNLGFEQLI